MQVPVLRTVASTKDYARAAINAWRFIYTTFPTKEQVGVLYAQWMVETGGKHCWNWNIGNVKVTQGQVDAGVPWFDLPGTWEIINGQRVTLKEGDPGRRFRAYASLDAGMAEHLAFLRNKRYAPSWPYVERGDPDGFARALKRQGYYTASADDYARIMVAAFKGWMASSAFDEELREAVMLSERETQPDFEPYEDQPATPRVVDFAIVRPRVPMDGGGDDGPDEAA